MNSHRILGLKNGSLLPLFGNHPLGPPSPSPTLPIEIIDILPSEWETHVIPRQMITLFLRPSVAMHVEQGGPTRRIAIPSKSIAFSLRAIEESIRWESAAKFMSLGLDDAVLMRTCESICRGGRFELIPSPKLLDNQMSSLLFSLYEESKAGYPAGRLYIDGLEQSLSALLVSKHNALSGVTHQQPISLSAGTARRLVDYMHVHLTEQMTLAELAYHTGYSESHFNRLFKATFGMPAHQYVMSLRVERAKQIILSKPHFSMLDVALFTGFANAQHFSKAFSKTVGITPTAFRRANR